MTENASLLQATRAEAAPAPGTGWGAVWALTLCAASLIASEFLPVSLLTPIADDLHVSEGAAGQAIAISGLFAVLTSLLLLPLTRMMDRKRVLLSLTALMVVSGIVVALAPTYFVLMVGRALIGVVIGGFWSMSAATVMRVLPEDRVPRGLALLNGGNAFATTVAAPLGSFLGQFIGWRGAFLMVVPLAVLTLAWQWRTLPAMPPRSGSAGASPLGVLKRRGARGGMLALALLFAGQFVLFTYLRPFLEQTTRMSVSLLSLALLGMGIAGLVGTWLIGRIVARSLGWTLTLAPLIMAAVALALIAFGRFAPPTGLLLMLWGLVSTALPVAWWTWLARTLPDDAEAGGGLMVAVIQLAITGGAAMGGLLFDRGGYRVTFAASAALLIASALVAMLEVYRLRVPTHT